MPLLLLLIAVAIGFCAFLTHQLFSSQGETPQAELEAPASDHNAEPLTSMPLAQNLEAPQLESELAQRSEAPSVLGRPKVSGPRLEILVLDLDSAPVAGAKLVLFREGQVLVQGETDDQGMAAFEALEGAGEYALAADGWDFARGELDLSEGQRTLTLPQGTSLGGAVLVDELAPLEPMELSWHSTDRTSGAEALPPAVVKALRVARGNRTTPLIRTRPDGTFELRGLPPDAAGQLRWSAACYLKDSDNEHEGRTFQVPTPRRDLRLELVTGVEVRLRVVDHLGVGVASAPVSVKREKTYAGGSSSSNSNSATADSAGRIVQAMQRDSCDKLTFGVAATIGGVARTYEFTTPPNLRGVWDLGDLATAQTRTLSVLIRDSFGQPIPEGDATAWPDTALRSNVRSDADGRIQITIAMETAEIAARAFGYESARVPVPADASEVVATLESACMLEFFVEGVSDNKQGLKIRLESPSPMFTSDDGALGERPTADMTLGGGWSKSNSEEKVSLEFEPERSGRWRVSGLVANQALRGTLKGTGLAMSEIEIAPLARGEHRVIQMQRSQLGQSFSVRVVSPEGKPLRQATVYVAAEEQWRGRGVNAEGELTLDSVYGDSCRLMAKAPGYGQKTVFLRPLPSGTVEIQLDTGRSIEIELLDAAGSLVSDGQVHAELQGRHQTSQAKAIGPGRFRLDDLPTEEVLLVVRGGEHWSSRLHDTNIGFVRIVVEPCVIRASVRIEDKAARSGWRISVALPGTAQSITRQTCHFSDEGVGQAQLSGLASGTYDVWLERESGDQWTRVGKATSATVDSAGVRIATVELTAPN